MEKLYKIYYGEKENDYITRYLKDYDYKNELYITGITDLGTSRTIVPTDLKVKEV